MNVDAITQLKQLWIETFHDSRQYVDMVFDNYYDPRLCLHVEEVETGRIVSAAYMWRCFLSFPGSENLDFPPAVGYICGLATVPQRRGEGIMRRLLEATEQVARENHFSCVTLIPADSSLREYYRGLGYRDMEPVKIVRLSNRQHVELTYLPDNILILDEVSIQSGDFMERLVKQLQRAEETVGAEMWHVAKSRQMCEDVIADTLRDGGIVATIKDMEEAVLVTADGTAHGLYGSDFGKSYLIFWLLKSGIYQEIKYKEYYTDENQIFLFQRYKLNEYGIDVLEWEEPYGMAKWLDRESDVPLKMRLMLD